MSVELRIKRIDTQELLVAEFESFEDAKAWAAERPNMVEVLGVVDPKAVGEAAFQELRAATRPLDPDERARRDEAAAKRLAQMRAQDVRESAPRNLEVALPPEPEPAPDPACLPDAAPNAVMVVRWQKGAPMANVADKRPIPDEVRKAVEAWVEQRNEWLHPKQAHVGRAELHVWPGELEGEEEDRIETGTSYSQLPGWAD